MSVGALDMVNFGPREMVPDRFSHRRFHVHNPTVTLMRTSAVESAQLGEIIAGKLNRATGPVTLLLPVRGVSALDKEGQPFWDAEADAALFNALRAHAGKNVSLIELDLHINDPEFADAVAQHLLTKMPEQVNAVHWT